MKQKKENQEKQWFIVAIVFFFSFLGMLTVCVLQNNMLQSCQTNLGFAIDKLNYGTQLYVGVIEKSGLEMICSDISIENCNLIPKNSVSQTQEKVCSFDCNGLPQLQCPEQWKEYQKCLEQPKQRTTTTWEKPVAKETPATVIPKQRTCLKWGINFQSVNYSDKNSNCKIYDIPNSQMLFCAFDNELFVGKCSCWSDENCEVN